MGNLYNHNKQGRGKKELPRFQTNQFFRLITHTLTQSLLEKEGIHQFLGFHEFSFTLDTLYKNTSEIQKKRINLIDQKLKGLLENDREFRVRFSSVVLVLDLSVKDINGNELILERESIGRNFDESGFPERLEHSFFITNRSAYDFVPNPIQFYDEEGQRMEKIKRDLMVELAPDLLKILTFTNANIDILRRMLEMKSEVKEKIKNKSITKDIAKRRGKSQDTTKRQIADIKRRSEKISLGMNTEDTDRIARFVKREILDWML